MQDVTNYSSQAARAVADFRAGTNSHWNDSYLNMGAQIFQSLIANDQNKELWNMMNEYNSPANQMKRFKEAGLNPMLAYTQGTPGNASSPPENVVPNYELHPQKDLSNQIAMANQVISMVSNLAGSITGLIDGGLDLQLKKNQVLESNFDREIMTHTFPYKPGVLPRLNYAPGHIQEALNPMSDKFDPLAFLAFQKRGQLPGFLNTFYSDDIRRMGMREANQLTHYKAEYQKWYNEHLAPLFERYQSGKATSSEIQAELDKYNQTAIEMLPPELRGILQPVVQYLSPFLKFIFKSSKFKLSR